MKADWVKQRKLIFYHSYITNIFFYVIDKGYFIVENHYGAIDDFKSACPVLVLFIP